VTTQHVTGLKQLWRLKYEAQVGESSDEKLVHFRPLVPSFEQNGVLVPQMEPDLIGRTLVRGSSSITVQGPWSSSGGPKATFAADILDLPANVSFTVSIEHRNPGETEGDETEAGSLSVTSGGAQLKKDRVTGLKPMYRYVYTLAGTASVGRVHFRMLPPVWEANT
jgi:hypothetical protein